MNHLGKVRVNADSRAEQFFSALEKVNELVEKPVLSRTEQRQLLALQTTIAALKNFVKPESLGAAQRKEDERRFLEFLLHGAEMRTTDAAAGSQSITDSAGSAGGYLAPTSFRNDVIYGMKLLTPLMDKDNVTLIETDDGTNLTVPGWDLSSITSSIIGENTSAAKTNMPAASKVALNAYTYRTDPIAASFEIEQDSAVAIMSLMSKAFSVGLARGIGGALATGTGTGEPTGILSAAASAGVTTASPSAITVGELEDVFFSVNKVYRNSPKCAWVFSDEQFKVVRAAATAERPLLLQDGDNVTLLGKKVLIDSNFDSTVAGSQFVFGDLSHYVVRIGGGLRVKRSTQTTLAVLGQAVYTARMRVDAGLLDPTAGAAAPVVYGKFST